MVIKELELVRFKKFLHKKITFDSGLNVVKGPNESGKSTLRTAIMTALFGNATGSSESIKKMTSWGEKHLCEIYMDFQDSKGMLCKLRKDFQNKKVFLICGDESYKMPKAIQAKLADETGIPTEELYYLSSSLDIRSLSNIGTVASRKQLGKMLSGLMTGTDDGQDVLQAIKKVSEATKELGKGLRSASKVPGPIKTVKDELIRLHIRRQEMTSGLDNYQRRQREKQQLSEELERDTKQYADLQLLLENHNKMFESQKRKTELVEQDNQYDQVEKQSEKLKLDLAELDQEIKKNAFIDINNQDVAAIRQVLRQKDELEKNEVQPVLDNKQSFLLLVVGLFFLVFGMVLLFISGSWGILVAGGGLVAGLLGWRNWSNTRKQNSAISSANDILIKSREKNNQELQNWKAQINHDVNDTFFEKWQTGQSLIAKKELLLNQQKQSLQVDVLKWQDIRRELRSIEDVINDHVMANCLMEPKELAGTQRTVLNLKEKIGSDQKKMERLHAILEHDQTNSDALATLEETIEASQKRLRYLERRNEICNLVFDNLEKARRDTLNPAREVLEKRAGALLEMFSNGRYHNIEVDDEDLSSKILIDQTGIWEDPVILSQGAFDQFYLSLRLALSEIIASGKKAPLFLDEPLSAFDDERLQSTLACFKQLSQDRQIFIFTCRDDYDKAADFVVDLSV